MSHVRDQSVFLMQVADLIGKAHDLGLVLTGGELYRTPEQQAIYVRTGRSKTTQSQHLKRLAIDLNFFERTANGALRLIYDSPAIRGLGAYWESLDPANRWGGNWTGFRDVAHFERREGVARAPPSPCWGGVSTTPSDPGPVACASAEPFEIGSRNPASRETPHVTETERPRRCPPQPPVTVADLALLDHRHPDHADVGSLGEPHQIEPRRQMPARGKIHCMPPATEGADFELHQPAPTHIHQTESRWGRIR